MGIDKHEASPDVPARMRVLAMLAYGVAIIIGVNLIEPDAVKTYIPSCEPMEQADRSMGPLACKVSVDLEP